MPTNTLPRDPALQNPTPAPAAPESQGRGAAPLQPDQASNPPSLQTSGGEAAPSPVPPSPAAPAAANQASKPPSLQTSEERREAPLLYTDANGRVTSVAPSREAEFLEDCRRAGLAVKRATQYRDAQGRVATVALDRREEFLADAQRAGLQVTELSPAQPAPAPTRPQPQTPEATPARRPAGAPPESPVSPEPPEPPAQSSRRQPAPNRPQSAESAVPQSGSPSGGEAAAQGRGAAPHQPGQASKPPSLQTSEGGGNAAAPANRQGVAADLYDIRDDAALEDFVHGLYDDGALRAQTFAQYMQRQGWNVTAEGDRVIIPSSGRPQTLTFLPEGGVQSQDPSLQAQLQTNDFMKGRGAGDSMLLHPAVRQALAFNNAVHQANLPRLYKLQADIAKHGAWGMPAPHVEMPDFGDKPFPQILLDAVADTGKAGWNSVVELGKGVVAIPTLSAQFGEWLSRQAGWTDEYSARLSDYGVKTLQLIDERLRAEYSWQDDPAREDPYGAKQTIAGIGEFMAQIGLASLASKGTGAAAKQTVKQTAGETAEGAAKQAAQKAAQETPESLAAVSAREAAERTAQSTFAAQAGEVSSAAVTREFGQNFMDIYGGKLRHKAMMDSLREFGNVKYISFSVSANSAIQVGNQYLASGRSRDEAFVAEVADFAVMLLTAQAGDAFGAYVFPGARQGVVGWAQAMALGAKNPATKAAIGQGLISAFANGTSNAAGDLFHTYMMMRGGAEITESDIWSIGLTSFLFGATAAGVLNLPAIRQANLADKKMMADLIAAKQDLSALATDNVYGGWIQIPDDAPLFTVGDTLATNTGKPQTLKDISLLSRPVAVNPSGYVLFSDGIIYRPGSDDFLTLDGRVFDRNANCTGVVGPRQDPIVPIAKPDTPTAPEGAPPESPESPESPEQSGRRQPAPNRPQSAESAVPPATPQGGEAVRALSLYQLLQTSDAQVYNVRVADILVNVDVKQFKSGADPNTGVVAGEELHGEFQQIPAKPIVVLQKLDGSLEVVTGRHRLDLARRNGLETIPANIIKEADGWTPESAALLDAFDNILDEKGSYADYVPFFRKAGISREVAEAYGLLARPKGRLSFEIAMNGTDDLVSFVAAGDKRVTPDVAAAICRAVPVPAAAREAGALTGQAARYDAIQHYVIRAVIDEGLRADQAEIMANGIRAEYAKRAEANTIQQDDLFGADETFNTEMALRAKYAGDQLAKINLDLRALKIVSGKQSGNVAAKDSLLKKYNIKGPDDSAGIERAIQELETLHHRWTPTSPKRPTPSSRNPSASTPRTSPPSPSTPRATPSPLTPTPTAAPISPSPTPASSASAPPSAETPPTPSKTPACRAHRRLARPRIRQAHRPRRKDPHRRRRPAHHRRRAQRSSGARTGTLRAQLRPAKRKRTGQGQAPRASRRDRSRRGQNRPNHRSRPRPRPPARRPLRHPRRRAHRPRQRRLRRHAPLAHRRTRHRKLRYPPPRRLRRPHPPDRPRQPHPLDHLPRRRRLPPRRLVAHPKRRRLRHPLHPP